MKINEIQKLNEYGDVTWNWFTSDPEILALDWEREIGPDGRTMADEHIDALDALELWDGYWHLLSGKPEGYPDPGTPDNASHDDLQRLSPIQKTNKTVRRFTKGLVDKSPGTETITMGPVDPDDTYGSTMELEGAIIFGDKVAAWYGDDSTWM